MDEQVGKYRLLDRIGEGGMGEVYRARLESGQGFARDVALKLIRREVALDPRMRELFLREGRALAALRHRGVVQVLELDSAGDRLYLAMELLDGVDLRRLLVNHGGRLPWATAAFIGSEVALALAAAHSVREEPAQEGLVHRDLSPSNVMVCRDGAVKVLDFGLARPSGAEQSVSGLQGKVHYASPEVIVGTNVDHRTDLYSLGVMLYEMVTGQQPFGGATDFDTMNQVLRNTVAPPSHLQTGVPPALDAIILKAMARDRAARYPDGQELARALIEQVGDRCRAADLPALLPAPAPQTKSSSASPAKASKPSTRTSRRPLLALAVTATALAVGVGVWELRRPSAEGPSPQPPAAPPTPRLAPTETPAPPQTAAAPAPGSEPAPAKKGTLVVMVDRSDAKIEIDGRVLAARADRARVDVTAAEPHDVRVTAPGAKPFRRSVTVGEGATIEVSATLRGKRPPGSAPPNTDDDRPIDALKAGKRK